MRPAALVRQGELPLEDLVHDAGAEDQQVVVRREPVGNTGDEVLQMFDPTRLAGGLGDTSATVAEGWIVPNVAGRPMVCRHVRFDSLEPKVAVTPASDHGSPSADPDE